MKKLITFLLLALVAFSLYSLGRFMLGGDIVLDVNGLDMNNTYYFVNDKQKGLYGYNEDSQSITLADVFGTQKIVVRGAGFEEQTIQQGVTFRGTHSFAIQLEEITAATSAQKLASTLWPAGTYSIANAAYEIDPFIQKRQLVFDATVDGFESQIVANYNPEKNEWEQVVSGD